MTRVYIDDAKALGYCARGCREFCVKHGFDWRDFLRNGIDESMFKDIDDEMVHRLVEHARRREELSNGR